jgi:hypothetical protein
LLVSQVLCGGRCPFDPLTWRTTLGTSHAGCKAVVAPALPYRMIRLRGRRQRSLFSCFVPLPLSHLLREVDAIRVSRVRQVSLTMAASVTWASWAYGSPAPLARVPPKLDLMPAIQGYPYGFGEVRSKVGAERTAELCFSTPPSEPGMRLSPHPALEGLASASGVTVGFVMFFAFAAASMILRDHRLSPTSGGIRQLIDQNIVNPLASFPM